MRILADHMRGCILMAMDGVEPSNKDQGYILRRLLRSMVRAGRLLGVQENISVNLVSVVCDMFSWLYSELPTKREYIESVFANEELKFAKTLVNGSKEAEKIIKNVQNLPKQAFDLYQSYGYPLEILVEDLQDAQVKFDPMQLEKGFNELVKTHQSGSRVGAEQKFKGGLADHSEQVVKYHTATHLLQAALRQVLGEHVVQRGSNITAERLRLDFPNELKLTEEQLDKVETVLNQFVDKKLPVAYVDLPKGQAEQVGAIHAFGEKYGDIVRIYYIGSSLESAVSKEFCGGPHVANTSEVGHIALYKQESIGKGIQRIYAKNID